MFALTRAYRKAQILEHHITFMSTRSMAQVTDHPGIANSTTPDQFLESLGRLSKKAGVLATLVLDRTEGGRIITTTGALTPSRSSTARSPSAPLSTADDSVTGQGEHQGVQEMASMVWSFVNATGDLVQGLDEEDEVKLLRLRTKKYELVIVPDPKYLLIVVHETPSA